MERGLGTGWLGFVSSDSRGIAGRTRAIHCYNGDNDESILDGILGARWVCS